MSSILTNSSAMNALSTLRNVNQGLNDTQGRISTGLKVQSAEDNASYFQLAETMKGDSSAYKAINESLTLTKNSVATARMGAENFQELAKQFTERLSFAQGAKGGYGEVENELEELLKQMTRTVLQSTFNGDDMVGATTTQGQVTANGGTADVGNIDGATGTVMATGGTTETRNVVTGVTCSGSFGVTTMEVETVDLSGLLSDFAAMAESFETNATAATGENFLSGVLASAEIALASATDAATRLGLSEKSIENQQEFLNKLTSNIESGVGAMVDAAMEEEAARLQALQERLVAQSLSIANQAPQNIFGLFR